MVPLDMPAYFYDDHQVRYELVATHEGKPYNWLFFPGGPGADSSYFYSLVDLLKLPGNTWLIDFPGNGGNKKPNPDYNYDEWLELFVPTIERFENPIVVGHSFGGMMPLLYPELENKLKGLVILNGAPCLWLTEAVEYAKQFNVPDLTQEMAEFTRNPSQETFEIALNACLPYYFPAKTLEQGRALLADVPFTYEAAVWGQRKVIETNYSAKWVPQKVPTLVLTSTYDCIIPHYLFKRDSRFDRGNIEMVHIKEGGHMSWVEEPAAVKAAFKHFVEKLN